MVTAKTLKLVLGCIGIVALAAAFIACRLMFGTYSFYEAVDIYSTLLALDKKYKGMFSKRENLRYHMGSAEARGKDIFHIN